MNRPTFLTRLARGAFHAGFSGLFLAFGVLPALAGTLSGGSSNPNPNGSTLVGSPGDDVGSLPARADSCGLTLVGDPDQIRALVATVNGQGRIDVVRLPRGGVAVTFVGNYRIEFDRAALARSNVGVLFRSGATFTDGRTRLALGDGNSAFLTPRRLPLPLSDLAASPRVQGDFLTLDLLGTTGSQAHVAADFGAQRVTLFQRLR